MRSKEGPNAADGEATLNPCGNRVGMGNDGSTGRKAGNETAGRTLSPHALRSIRETPSAGRASGAPELSWRGQGQPGEKGERQVSGVEEDGGT